MFKPSPTEMQGWLRIQQDTKIAWSHDPQDIVLAIGNLPEFEIVGTPDALRRFFAKGTEAITEFEEHRTTR